MSRAPWVLLKPAKGFPAGHETLHSTTLGWRMVNPAMPGEWTIAARRERRDAGRPVRDHAARSRTRSRCAAHQRAAKAWDDGVYDDEVVPVAGQRPRRATRASAPDTQLETLARLKPAFRKDGTVTAGNASPLNDGAAALFSSATRASPASAGARRWPASSRAPRPAVDPQRLRHRPGRGRRTGRWPRAGIGWADLDVVELNEAFAVAVAGLPAAWPELDPDDRQRQRRRDRDRPPAGRSRRAHPRHPRPRAAPPRRRLRAWPRSASASARAWPWSCEPGGPP